jgi:hypothetical protein
LRLNENRQSPPSRVGRAPGEKKTPSDTSSNKLPSRHLSLNDVCNRSWQEVGQHHTAARNMTFPLLALLTRHFGKTRLLTDIRDDDVAKLVAWRRDHRVVRKKGAKPEDCLLIAPRAVNDATEQLKKLFTRAKLWGVKFDCEPRWKKHWLKEPKERVRELHQDEADRLGAKMRDDYAPFFAFVAASGMRRNVEARDLRWSEVSQSEGQIKRKGKNDVDVVIPDHTCRSCHPRTVARATSRFRVHLPLPTRQ